MDSLSNTERERVKNILQRSPMVINKNNGNVYKRTGYLGKGQFGWVWKVIDKEGYQYAMKDLRITKGGKSESFWKTVTSEINILRRLNHKHIIQLIDDFSDERDYHMVTSYCDGGNLEDLIYQKEYMNKGLNEDLAIKYLMQMMFALKELYKCKIIHRDIKLANMFLHKNNIIVGDFGFAKHDVDSHFSKIGTPYYMAPEVINKKPEDMYSNKSDLWSVGVCFYFILFGNLPFPAKTESELLNMIQNRSGKRLDFKNVKKVSILCRNILIRLIEPDPKKRMDFAEFFNHQIFREYCKKYNTMMPTHFGRTKEDQVFIGYRPDPREFNAGGYQSSNSCKQNPFKSPQTNQGFMSEENKTRITPSFNNAKYSNKNTSNNSRIYSELSNSMRVDSNTVSSSQYDSQTSNYDLLEETLYDKAFGPYFFEKNLIIFLLETSKKLRLLCDIRFFDKTPQMKFTAFVGAYLVARLTENISGKVAKSMIAQNNVFHIANFDSMKNKEDFQIIKEFFAQANEFSGNYKEQIKEQICAKFSSNKKEIEHECRKMNMMRTDNLKTEMKNCLKAFSMFYFKCKNSFPTHEKKLFTKSFVWMHLVLNMEKYFKVPQFISSYTWKKFEEDMLAMGFLGDEEYLKNYIK
jgi:serine/threonine protein kinase